jgi:secreted trypsin-like serine protease
MAALGYLSKQTPGEYEWNCGASLISSSFVLTAAHCVVISNKPDDKPVVVRLGVTDLNDVTNTMKQDIQIKRTIPHEGYSRVQKYHDIALVELEKPAQLTLAVIPVCLNTKAQDDPSTILTTEGWGFTDPVERTKDPRLRKVDLTVVPLETCENELVPNNRKSLSRGITDSMICTKGEKGQKYFKDACSGDSGGPLHSISTEHRGKFLQHGVTSFGFGCGNNVSSVFTRVATYVDWIAGHVWP